MVWMYCHWPLDEGRPTAPLSVQVTELAVGNNGGGWSKRATIAPSARTDGNERAPGLVQCWDEGMDGTYAQWSCVDFTGTGGLTFRSGRIYVIELSSTTPATRPYKLHPIQTGQTINPDADDAPGSDLHLWKEDPAKAGAASYAERSTDGAASWRGLRASWDAADAERDDISLPVWFETRAATLQRRRTKS